MFRVSLILTALVACTPLVAQDAVIVAIVNGEPISRYHVEGRTIMIMHSTNELGVRVGFELKRRDMEEKFKAFSMKRLQANPPKSEKDQKTRIKALQEEFVALVTKQVENEMRPKIAKEALNELFEERLKMVEATRRKLVATDEAVAKEIASMDNRRKGANKKKLDALGNDKDRVMASRKDYVLAELSWRNVVKDIGGERMSKAAFDETSERTLKALKLDSNIEYR